MFTAYGVVDDHDQLHQLYEEIKRLVVARYDMVVTDGDPDVYKRQQHPR